MIILVVATFIQVAASFGMPLFSDSAFHASIIRSINETGIFPTFSPVGWVALDMHPTSFSPYLTHPPLFYILGSYLSHFGFSIRASLSVINIMPTVAAVYFFYKLVKSFFNTQIALLSALILAFLPLSIWLVSHRIMEPLQYLLSMCTFYYAKKFIDTKFTPNLWLAAVFASGILYIKITSLFIVLSFIAFLVLMKVRAKLILATSILIFTLYLPYMAFSISSRGSFAYAPPGFPIIDSKILKPWWNRKLSDEEVKLNAASNNEYLQNKIRQTDRDRRLFIQDNIKKGDAGEIFQYFNPYPVSGSANPHWYSTIRVFTGLFTVMSVIGLVIYFKKHRKNKFHYLILPLFLFTAIYLTQVTEIRYFFTLNILFIVFYSLTICELINSANKWPVRYSIFASLIIILSITAFSEILHSYRYKSSFIHNTTPTGQGISELPKVNLSDDQNGSSILFTPANSEASYYLNRTTIWDYRLFFVDKYNALKYLNEYKVKYLIIPNNYLNQEIYSFEKQREVVNDKSNWQGSSIPIDSDFYQLLNNSSVIVKTQSFGAFSVYEVKL